MKTGSFLAIAGLSTLSWMNFAAYGQINTATVSGSVTDATHAIIPGAKIQKTLLSSPVAGWHESDAFENEGQGFRTQKSRSPHGAERLMPKLGHYPSFRSTVLKLQSFWTSALRDKGLKRWPQAARR